MKIFFLLFLSACTQKYIDYDLVRKSEFPGTIQGQQVTLMQVLPQGKDELKKCFHQWLFFSNAEKEKDSYIPYMVRMLCPGKEFLVNAHLTERWWTSIIYSQSCVNIETSCAVRKAP